MKYSDLKVWQRAMNFVQKKYEGRKTTQVYINHLSIAFGSLMEVETQLQIAHRLKYINTERLQKCLEESEEIGKMLSGLIRSLRAKV